MAFRIYTKTGDSGNTSLIGGTKVSKAHLRIETYGTVDELNSHIGLVADLLGDLPEKTTLLEVQDRLFTIGAALACDPAKESPLQIPDLFESDVELLEQHIDAMEATLPAMKSFVLPGGHPTVSQVHIARCVCRRAERCIVHLQAEAAQPLDLVVKYVNRLSDYLFVLSRFAAQHLRVPEVPWRPRVR
ncbi:MAG: cob(I)yrinic acid a,c-diamide adenosyltransferase [Chitinophagaceae bacterium]|nr:cob(I)yrinic acid a,c-diamide adenosyltransferase [Chitinophagaceae bacterium]